LRGFGSKMGSKFGAIAAVPTGGSVGWMAEIDASGRSDYVIICGGDGVESAVVASRSPDGSYKDCISVLARILQW
jgi:hypothetical protein